MKKILALLLVCGLTTVNAMDKKEDGDPVAAAAPSQTLHTVNQTVKDTAQEIKDTTEEINNIIETSNQIVQNLGQTVEVVEDDLAKCGCFGGGAKKASAKKGSKKKK